MTNIVPPGRLGKGLLGEMGFIFRGKPREAYASSVAAASSASTASASGARKRAALDLRSLPALNSPDQSEGFLILDETISRLESADPQAAQIIRLRFYAGLTVEETAAALGVSAPTVKRTWVFARAWLKDAIEGS